MTDEPLGMTRRRFLQALGGLRLAGGVSFLVARGSAFRPAPPAAGRAGAGSGHTGAERRCRARGRLERTSKIVVPTTLGIDTTRKLLVAGEPLRQVWSDGTLPWALLHAALLLLLGAVVYQAAIRRGLREGRLGG
jgi:hypothetical protein